MYEEMLPRVGPVPALGESAIAPCRVDALLLSCVHPAMHHRNDERLLWILDIHLLASGLSADERNEFQALARAEEGHGDMPPRIGAGSGAVQHAG